MEREREREREPSCYPEPSDRNGPRDDPPISLAATALSFALGAAPRLIRDFSRPNGPLSRATLSSSRRPRALDFSLDALPSALSLRAGNGRRHNSNGHFVFYLKIFFCVRLRSLRLELRSVRCIRPVSGAIFLSFIFFFVIFILFLPSCRTLRRGHCSLSEIPAVWNEWRGKRECANGGLST